MALLVQFVSTTVEKFEQLTQKDAGTLYSLNNGHLYKGDTLVNNVQIVSTFPETGINHTLYIHHGNGEMRYYEDGYGYIVITRPFITEINDSSTHNQTASAAAVKTYVDTKTSETLVFSTYIEFPVSGKSSTLYIDKGANKTYRYDEDSSSYYVVGSDYNDITVINGDF